LLLLALFLYVPFRSRMVYLWDGAEFAMAIRDYNVALSQPHPPGYFLYVMLGRLVNQFVGDPHASLVWMSVAAGGGLTAVMYLLGTAMVGRRAGVAAALFAMTSPMIWFYSCVALTYMVDAFLVCVMVLWCWRAVQRGGAWGDAVGLGVLLAVMGGVRQQTVVAMVPLLAFVFWNFQTPRLGKAVAAAVVAAVVCAVWMNQMAHLSGGWGLYREALERIIRYQSAKTLAGGGGGALAWNFFFVGLYCGNGLMLGVVLLAGALFYRAFGEGSDRRREWDRQHALAVRFLWLWILPMVLLGTLVGYTEAPGHVFTYLPGWLMVAAVVAAQLRGRWMFTAVVGMVCAVNVFAFTAWPPQWDGIFWGTGRTAREIRQHDARLQATAQLVSSRYSPTEAVLCFAQQHLLFGMRHFQLCLPNFDQYQLLPDRAMVAPEDKPLLRVHEGQLEFVGGIERDGKHTALLIVPPEGKLEMFNPYCDTGRATEVAGSSGTVYAISLDAIADRPSRRPPR
jgi:hypothetical protein